MTPFKNVRKIAGLSVIVCALFGASTSYAYLTPQGLHTDDRIKVVPYSANQVINVYATFGYATTIELEQGEYVVNQSGFGKKEGWDVKSSAYDNKIIIKPLIVDATTNLNFTTNRHREYTLLLVPSANEGRQTFRLRFDYPKLDFGRVFSSKRQTSRLIRGFGNPKVVNERYSFWGDKSIAPISAKDNGTFTLLKFKPKTPIPSILAVDLKTRKESMVNFRLQEGYVVVEGVYGQYTLRYGDHATCLFNDKMIKRA